MLTLQNVANELVAKFGNYVGSFINQIAPGNQERPTSFDKQIVLRGDHVIYETMRRRSQIDTSQDADRGCDDIAPPLTFAISPASFFQTNTRGAEMLYALILQSCGLREGKQDVVYDLFCGVGSIGMYGKKRRT